MLSLVFLLKVFLTSGGSICVWLITVFLFSVTGSNKTSYSFLQWIDFPFLHQVCFKNLIKARVLPLKITLFWPSYPKKKDRFSLYFFLSIKFTSLCSKYFMSWSHKQSKTFGKFFPCTVCEPSFFMITFWMTFVNSRETNHFLSLV